jgi:hypothetical protein
MTIALWLTITVWVCLTRIFIASNRPHHLRISGAYFAFVARSYSERVLAVAKKMSPKIPIFKVLVLIPYPIYKMMLGVF